MLQTMSTDAVPPVTERLNELFAVCEEMIAAATAALEAMDRAQPETLAHFDQVVFARAIAIVRAARSLVEVEQWETATVCARQLYELLLNLESMAKGDRSDRYQDFLLFAMLQRFLFHLAAIGYGKAKGHSVPEGAEEHVVRSLAEPHFDRFRIKKPGKPDMWESSWNGENVWSMAKTSSSKQRKLQYHVLYKRWSEEVHAAPSAFLRRLFPYMFAEDGEPEYAEDDRQATEVLILVMTLFIELWWTLPGAPPGDAEVAHGWVNRMSAKADPVWELDVPRPSQ